MSLLDKAVDIILEKLKASPDEETRFAIKMVIAKYATLVRVVSKAESENKDFLEKHDKFKGK